MEEKKNIGQLFDRIALTYDRFNHLLSLNIDRRWRKKAVMMLKPSDRLLDVAIGTADLALEIMKRGKAATVIGLDLSVEMMKIGRKKVRAEGLEDKVSFIEGSALSMPFEDGSFDSVTCAYGVRNFSDLDAGLSEMFRVLKSGGQLVILEFSYPSNRLVRAVYDFFFCNIMPLVGKLISKDAAPYKYFRQSVKSFIWGEEMLRHIVDAGFCAPSFKTLTFGISTIYTAEKV